MTDNEYLDLDRKVWCVVHGAAAAVLAGIAAWLLLQPGVSALLKITYCVPAGIRIFLDARECLRLRRKGASVRRGGYDIDPIARARELRMRDPAE